MEAKPTDAKLVLMHGAPGTGKTSVLRSLALEWSTWASAHVVLDPERFFEDPSYLLDILNPDGVGSDAAVLQPVVFIEDADEFLRPDAKSSAGQALARLLNLTDGMLGQGLRFLVVITTNERLSGLHPAVTRPGRCRAAIEFRRFTAREAAAWLGRPHRGDASLAELLREADELEQLAIVEDRGEPIGQYL